MKIFTSTSVWNDLTVCLLIYLFTQDVDLVHCRIGKIEGLEVLQKAKVRYIEQLLSKKFVSLNFQFFSSSKRKKYSQNWCIVNPFCSLSTQTLSLRQNLIKKIENLDSLSSLWELDLYDNQIRKLENLNKLTQLE